MPLWKVQAGKAGEQESAIPHGLVAIGWSKLPDLSHCKSVEDVSAIYRKLYPEKSKQQ
jgi:hypothetical protein